LKNTVILENIGVVTIIIVESICSATIERASIKSMGVIGVAVIETIRSIIERTRVKSTVAYVATIAIIVEIITTVRLEVA
jgi:hypothetical protein